MISCDLGIMSALARGDVLNIALKHGSEDGYFQLLTPSLGRARCVSNICEQLFPQSRRAVSEKRLISVRPVSNKCSHFRSQVFHGDKNALLTELVDSSVDETVAFAFVWYRFHIVKQSSAC